MSVSIQRDMRDAFEVAMRKEKRALDFTLVNGTYRNPFVETTWQEFLRVGVDVLPTQGRA